MGIELNAVNHGFLLAFFSGTCIMRAIGGRNCKNCIKIPFSSALQQAMSVKNTLFLRPFSGQPWHAMWAQYLVAVVSVALITVLAQALNALLPHTSLLLLFMTGVVIVSATTSLGPSILSGLLSFVSFNFFFTEPYHTLDVYHRTDLATLILFLLVTIITGNLASRMRNALSASAIALDKLDNLYAFSQKMSSAASEESVLNILESTLSDFIRQPVLLISRQDDKYHIHAAQFADKQPTTTVLEQAWQSSMAHSLSVDRQWRFFPVTVDKQTQVLVATWRIDDKERIETCQALCQLAALALQRTRLVADLQHSKVVSETEQLRSALLSSVSHDLRTPLASVIGAASSLVELGDQLALDKQRALLNSILNESERLDRHIQNLLDMTRFGQGKVALKRDWVDIRDIISGALARLDDSLHDIDISVSIEPAEPIISLHGLLIEQALVNVVDNALRFSPEHGRIQIRVKQGLETIVIEVADQGPGIADKDKIRIFDMFYSLHQGDQHHRAGAGLGLAIAQGMIGAHGGSIEALDDIKLGGALIRMTLPWTPHLDAVADET